MVGLIQNWRKYLSPIEPLSWRNSASIISGLRSTGASLFR